MAPVAPMAPSPVPTPMLRRTSPRCASLDHAASEFASLCDLWVGRSGDLGVGRSCDLWVGRSGDLWVGRSGVVGVVGRVGTDVIGGELAAWGADRHSQFAWMPRTRSGLWATDIRSIRGWLGGDDRVNETHWRNSPSNVRSQ